MGVSMTFLRVWWCVVSSTRMLEALTRKLPRRGLISSSPRRVLPLYSSNPAAR